MSRSSTKSGSKAAKGGAKTSPKGGAKSGAKSAPKSSGKGSAGKGASGKRQRDEARIKAAAMRAEAKRKEKRRNQVFALSAGLVVLVLVGVIAFALYSGNQNEQAKAQASVAEQQAAVDKASTVTPEVFDAAGVPQQLPSGVVAIKDGKPSLTKDGKAHLIYVGGEYCPYCAIERWAVVAALSRFGTFSDLKPTFSADNEGTVPSMTFHGSKYTSEYIKFDAYEDKDRNRKPLDTIPADVAKLLQTYDAPPYTQQQGQPVPWMWYGTWQSIGLTVQPLEDFISKADGQTTVTHQDIADGMVAGKDGPGKDELQAANVITAQLCSLTQDKPANVCSSPAVMAAKKLLPTRPPAGA